MTGISDVTVRSVWRESHPLDMWRYDYPDREMSAWEMPLHRVLLTIRQVLIRYVIVWHLIVTPRNDTKTAPWEDRGVRRWKTLLALLLPISVHWHYPDWPVKADCVLIWWSSGTSSTPDGLSWSTYCVGIGYGWDWRLYVYEDGE